MVEKTTKKLGTWWKTLLVVVFWLLVWQVASMAIGQVLFLPSPLQTLGALTGLIGTGEFWRSVGTSLSRIALGFLLGFVLGVVLAWLSALSQVVRLLLRPLLLLVRATPVASFIILALVWVSSRNLSVFISFLMVLPTIYNTTLSGIGAASPKLLEMAKIFQVGRLRRVRAVYLPALLPSLLSGSELALGLCWKSGIAAEVIGLPSNTIGEQLYQAKIYLMTPELFAWTAVIILLSWGFGKIVLFLMRTAARRLERGWRV